MGRQSQVWSAVPGPAALTGSHHPGYQARVLAGERVLEAEVARDVAQPGTHELDNGHARLRDAYYMLEQAAVSHQSRRQPHLSAQSERGVLHIPRGIPARIQVEDLIYYGPSAFNKIICAHV